MTTKEPEMVEVFEVIRKLVDSDNYYLEQTLFQEDKIKTDWIKTGRSFMVPKD